MYICIIIVCISLVCRLDARERQRARKPGLKSRSWQLEDPDLKQPPRNRESAIWPSDFHQSMLYMLIYYFMCFSSSYSAFDQTQTAQFGLTIQPTLCPFFRKWLCKTASGQNKQRVSPAILSFLSSKQSSCTNSRWLEVSNTGNTEHYNLNTNTIFV